MDKIPIRSIKTTNQEPDLSESFRIRDVQVMLGGKDMVQEIHRHDFFFILALKKGTGNHEIDFESYKIRNNSIYIMRPGQVHQLTLKAKSEGYLIEFKADFFKTHDTFINQLLRRVSGKNLYQPDPKNFIKITTLLTNICQEYVTKQDEFQEVIKANLAIFFVELIRNRQNDIESTYTYEQARLEEFLELLQKHIASHKQVSHYADMLNLSTYQLNAITKTTLGKTCSKLIDEHIILEAKRYLLATTDQVNQTAFQLGFEDVSYFIRFFKKYTGYSPESFRHKFK